MRWTKEEIGETKAQLERVKALMLSLPAGLVRQQLEPAVAAAASAVTTMEAELWSKGAVGVPTSIRVDCKCLWKGSRQAQHRHVALVGTCLTIGRGNRLEEAISVRGVSASAQGIAMVVWDGDAIILRMWLSSAQEALQWALAVDKASQSEDAEDCMPELKTRVARMQRGVARRRISEKVSHLLPCFAFLADGRTSTAKWQEWQDQSFEQKHNAAAKSPASRKTLIGHIPFFTKGMLSKEPRHLALDGDLLEVGREEWATDVSIGLNGAKVNASRGMVSAWVNETQLFRFWMDGEEEAQRWASALQSAACLFAKRGGEGNVGPTDLLLAEHAGLALKAERASQAAKATESPDANTPRGTGRIRAQKYISPPSATAAQARSPPAKNSPTTAVLPPAAVGA